MKNSSTVVNAFPNFLTYLPIFKLVAEYESMVSRNPVLLRGEVTLLTSLLLPLSMIEIIWVPSSRSGAT